MVNERSLIKLIRRDISNSLIHLTKSTEENEAIDVLRKIIIEGRLTGVRGLLRAMNNVFALVNPLLLKWLNY